MVFPLVSAIEHMVMVAHLYRTGTNKSQGYCAGFDGHGKILMLDTPGFDDTARSDLDIVREILLGLEMIDLWGGTIVGVIYTQRISDARMSGSARRSLEILDAICGRHASANITFVTTMWDKLEPEESTLGDQRTEQLKRLFLGKFIERGAQIERHDGTKASAYGIMDRFLLRTRNTLEMLALQVEMLEGDVPLEQTGVGKVLRQDLQQQHDEFNAAKREIEQQLLEAQQLKDRELVELLSAENERVESQLRKSQDSQMQLRYNAYQLRARSNTESAQQRESIRKPVDIGTTSSGDIKSRIEGAIQRRLSIKQISDREAEGFDAVMRREREGQRRESRQARKDRDVGRSPTVWEIMMSTPNPPRHKQNYMRKRSVNQRQRSLGM
jgi:hypothetical protein